MHDLCQHRYEILRQEEPTHRQLAALPCQAVSV